MRLNKYISTSGVCSRRKADEYILEGKVKINGEVKNTLGIDIDIAKDIVEFDGKRIYLVNDKIYIMLNKPEGYVTTSKEQFGRPSVLDLIYEDVRVFPVGRLDMYTEGLLLLTNDGDFANKMMHPKNKVKKVYVAKVIGEMTEQKLDNLRNGVDIDGYKTQSANVKRVSKNSIEITISEGKNRQVRKMCETQDLKVVKLKRIQVGNIKLGDLETGKYVYISKKQIENI